MKCMETAGFLIPRPCRNLPVTQCCLCQKAICAEHTVAVPGVGNACTRCAAARNVGPGAEQQHLRQAYGYDDAYFYGAHGAGLAYTAADYAAFERSPEEGEPVERLDES